MVESQPSRESYMPFEGSSMCALIQDLLPLYLEGEVSPESRPLIVTHLNECAHCAGFLAGAQSVRSQFLRDEQSKQQGVAPSVSLVATLEGLMLQMLAGVGLFAVFGFVVTVLLQIRWMSPFDILSAVLTSPQHMLIVAELGTLATLSLLLLLRPAQLPKLWRLGMLLFGMLLFFVGTLLPNADTVTITLRGLILLESLAGLWFWRHDFLHVLRTQFAVVFGLVLILLGFGSMMTLFAYRVESQRAVFASSVPDVAFDEVQPDYIQLEDGTVIFPAQLPTAVPPDGFAESRPGQIAAPAMPSDSQIPTIIPPEPSLVPTVIPTATPLAQP